MSDLDLSSPDLRRQRRPAAGRIVPAWLCRPRPKPARPAKPVATDEARKALIDRAVRAKGGLELLSTIRTVQADRDT